MRGDTMMAAGGSLRLVGGRQPEPSREREDALRFERRRAGRRQSFGSATLQVVEPNGSHGLYGGKLHDESWCGLSVESRGDATLGAVVSVHAAGRTKVGLVRRRRVIQRDGATWYVLGLECGETAAA